MTTEFDSSKELVISHAVSLATVPVSVGTGAERSKLNLCKCRVFSRRAWSKH